MEIYYTHSFKNRKDSHKLLEQVLGSIEGLTKSEAGKPFIPGGRHFSISHSEGSWAVLLADEECGLDIQFERTAKELKIAERWYHPDEVAAVADGEEAFFRIWARREALVKAAGTGIMNASLPSTLGEEVDYEGARWQLKDVEIPGIDHAAVCAKTIDEIKIIEL